MKEDTDEKPREGGGKGGKEGATSPGTPGAPKQEKAGRTLSGASGGTSALCRLDLRGLVSKTGGG